MGLLSPASYSTRSRFPGVWSAQVLHCLWPSSCQVWLTPVPSLPCTSRRPMGTEMSPGIAYECV